MSSTNGAPAAGKLWGGRFTGGLDPIMVQYNESIYFDRAFYSQDIRGSIAYARANTKNGILTQHEFSEIQRGFEQVRKEWESNSFEIKSGIDEDIHTANERRLGEIIGKEIAGKLHTGRSRNDQVATDLRMYVGFLAFPSLRASWLRSVLMDGLYSLPVYSVGCSYLVIDMTSSQYCFASLHS